jgi:hypothetical protein
LCSQRYLIFIVKLYLKYFSIKLAGYLTTNELKSYAKAGAVAEEIFTAIRTVFAFNGSQVLNEKVVFIEKELKYPIVFLERIQQVLKLKQMF